MTSSGDGKNDGHGLHLHSVGMMARFTLFNMLRMESLVLVSFGAWRYGLDAHAYGQQESAILKRCCVQINGLHSSILDILLIGCLCMHCVNGGTKDFFQ
jgi:hypothetical protein